jgi:tetratricopeptide (TPR) repeat protein
MMYQSKNIVWVFLLLLLPVITFAGRKDKKKKGKDKKEQISKSDEIAVQSLFLEATKAKILEDFQEAVNKFEKVVRMDPNNATAFYELSMLFYKSKQFELAQKYINEAVKVDDTKNKWYLILQAEIYNKQGDNEAAAESYAKLLEYYPDEIDYYFDLAFQQIKSEEYKDALKTYESLEEIIGFNEGTIVQKQRLYIKMGDMESAIKEINRLIESDSENPKYYQLLAELYHTNNMKEEEEKAYRKIMELSPNNPYALFNMADIKFNEGDRGAYMKYLRKAFGSSEVDADTKIRVLFPYLTDPNIDSIERTEAIELVEIASEVHPESAKVQAIYGDFSYQMEQYDSAKVHYRKAIELDDSVFEVWQQLAFILSDQQEYDELIELTDNAMELFPSQAILYFFNGMALNQKKEHQEAIDILEAGKDLVVNNSALKSQMFATLGDAYNSIKSYSKSDAAFESALELDPENSYVMNNYSYYLTFKI